jgi:hypothetical protein
VAGYNDRKSVVKEDTVIERVTLYPSSQARVG